MTFLEMKNDILTLQRGCPVNCRLQ